MATFRSAGGVATLGALVLMAGCLAPGGVDEYVIAFKVTDDQAAYVEDTSALAAWLEARTGKPTRVLTVQDDRSQITALATGQAHVAYTSGGPAWIGWQSFGLDAIAAEVREEGRTSYVAGLWVMNASGMETIEDLRGKSSCHTGELTGTGMLVPIGYLIGNGYVDTTGLDMNDVSSVHQARERFFGASKIGGGYLGAFQCLSTGEGDVGTGRDTAWDDFCGGDAPASWCHPRDAYRFLPDEGLARVPSHPLMVNPNLPAEDRDALLAAFLALNDDAEGQAILRDVFGIQGLAAVDAATHLGPYGAVLENVPGIEDHVLGGG